jgi:hypothetical protein
MVENDCTALPFSQKLLYTQIGIIPSKRSPTVAN